MKKLMMVLLIILPIHSYALITEKSHEGMVMAVVQDEYRFDFDNIKSASLIKNNDSTFKGLLVELKPKAISSFTKMTQDGFNKEMVIILNNKVISASVLKSPLGGQVLISGISLADAETFLTILHDKKNQKDKIANEKNNAVLFAD